MGTCQSTRVERVNEKNLSYRCNWSANYVLEGLFVGDFSSAIDVDNLRKHNIICVLTAGMLPEYETFPTHFPKEIRRCCLNILDMPDQSLFEEMEIGLQFMDFVLLSKYEKIYDDENFKSLSLYPPSLLVHCSAGISRSPSLCIAWLMTRKNYDFEDALQLLQKCRPIVDLNCGFEEQLKILSLTKSIERAKVRYKEILYEQEINHCQNSKAPQNLF